MERREKLSEYDIVVCYWDEYQCESCSVFTI